MAKRFGGPQSLKLVATMNSDLTTTGFGDADALVKALRPWQGGRAAALSFTASHDRLEIWLSKPPADWIVGKNRVGGVLLTCVRCVTLRFQTVWGPTDIQVSGTARGKHSDLVLRDGDSFEMRCWDAQVTGVFPDFDSMCIWDAGL